MNTTALPTGPSTRTRRLLATAASIGTAVVLTAAMAQASDGGTTPATASAPTAAPTALTMHTDRIHQAWSFRTIDNAADPTFNQLLGITNRGRIVGYFGSGADAAHPNKGFAIRSPYGQNNIRNENFPGSAQTQVVGINNDKTTVGFFVDAAGANVGFVEHGGRFTAVANPATPATAPFNQLLGVNDYGVAVGFFDDAAGASHGYTYDTRDGSFADVALPMNPDGVTATGIADDGTLSGFFTKNKATFGFLLHHGVFRQLSFGAGTNTQALGVNDGHQVVGSYLDAAGTTHGFVWSAGRGLTRVDEPDATTSTVVNGLNSRGQLVGFYVDRAGNTHGFLAKRRS